MSYGYGGDHDDACDASGDHMPCPNCGGCNWVEDPVRGDIICHECGMVQPDRMMDMGHERRTFADSTTDNRRGTQVADPYLSALATTTIRSASYPTLSASAPDVTHPSSTMAIEGMTQASASTPKRGKKVPRGRATSCSSLQKAQSKLSGPDSKRDQHLLIYFKQIKVYCDLLDLQGRVLDTAKTVMYQFEEARGDLRRYLPVQAGALAAIHVGCLEAQSGRTMSDLVADLRIAGCTHTTGLPTEKEVWQTRKRILKQLPAWSRQNDTGDIIQQVCTTLEMPHDVCRVAMHMQERIQPLVEGKALNTVAAGCIVLALRYLDDTAVDMEAISAVANVSEGTIVNLVKIGRQNWGRIVPPPTSGPHGP